MTLEDFRQLAIIAAMQGIVSNHNIKTNSAAEIAEAAVELADALVDANTAKEEPTADVSDVPKEMGTL